MQRAVVIHYHEINLKGGNRGWFESRLQKNVEALLEGIAHRGITRFAGRMLVKLSHNSPLPEVELRLRKAFGIANFAIAWQVPADLDAIRSALDSLIAARNFQSFKIEARRGTKDFALNSQQLNEQLGAFVQQRCGARVLLDKPDLTIYVEIAGPHAFLYFEKLAGAGGLPALTGGRVLCLISGGIDSPVAAFRMMRRGCRVLFVHFHSFPHTSSESQDKVRRILRILSCYQLQSKLYLVPFAGVQREIVAYSPPPLRVILYRRFMMRIAEAIANRNHALALVTGDSLGQVASQTLENMRAISGVARLPIFRPLVGDDKEDIIRAAREIGSYEISVLPDQDCCSLFVPRHPETTAEIGKVEQAEGLLDTARLIENALGAATHETILPDFSGNFPITSDSPPIISSKGG